MFVLECIAIGVFAILILSLILADRERRKEIAHLKELFKTVDRHAGETRERSYRQQDMIESLADAAGFERVTHHEGWRKKPDYTQRVGPRCD